MKVASFFFFILLTCFSITVPPVQNPWNQPLPTGLLVIPDFIDEHEEAALLLAIDAASPSTVNAEEAATLRHRQVHHFGYEFIYGTNNVDRTKPLSRAIPIECERLWPRLRQHDALATFETPDQLTVNVYEPGQGIPAHCDTHSCFANSILSLSLCGNVCMEFRRNGTERPVNCWLPRRSLLIMSGESRYGWTHGITPRKFDIVTMADGGQRLTVAERTKRISMTFRKTMATETTGCECGWPKLCDTAAMEKCAAESSANDGKTVTAAAAKLEAENVHRVYDEIANHFSETRHSPWPQVEEFVRSFAVGDVLLDVGCGNGKYLALNENICNVSLYSIF